ncbi:MAG TPA: hypothetical protein VF427_06930 [Noviherbaspirillum sp.]
MDFVLIELILWGGLVFFFWALQDGLGHVESDIESLGMFNSNARQTMVCASELHYVQPQHVMEPIGSYQGMQIHRYAIVDGRKYQFDRVCPTGCVMTIESNERCVMPGLIYRVCGGW